MYLLYLAVSADFWAIAALRTGKFAEYPFLIFRELRRMSSIIEPEELD
jgi:hypothetical protein